MLILELVLVLLLALRSAAQTMTNAERFASDLPPNPPKRRYIPSRTHQLDARASPYVEPQPRPSAAYIRRVETYARIGVYTLDGMFRGYLEREYGEERYKVSKASDVAELFTLPNPGPSRSNTIRTESAALPFFGAVLQSDTDEYGGVGGSGTNYLSFSAVSTPDDYQPVEAFDSYHYETSNVNIPSHTYGALAFEFHNPDGSMGKPGFYYNEEEEYLFAATEPEYITAGIFSGDDEVVLRFLRPDYE